jgi:spermidine synthase
VRYLLAVCFVFSGAAGLIFELEQALLLGNLIGAGAWSHVVVLTAFFGGSAIGAALFGRLVDRIPQHALSLYVALELAVAAFAIVGVEITAAAGSLWSTVSAHAEPDASLLPLRFAIAALALLPATIAMGGTLPILARWIRAEVPNFGAQLATFYSLNALGAAIGVLLAGFVLTPTFGAATSLRLAAVGNLVAVGLALLARLIAPGATAREEDGRDATRNTPDPGATNDEAAHEAPAPRLLLLGAFAGGAAALVMEIAWTRMFAIVFGSSAHAFTLMLAAFVLGISGGGMLTSRLLARGVAPLRIARGAWTTAAVVLVLQLPLYLRLPFFQFALEQALERRADVYGILLFVQAIVALAWMLPVTLASGAALPALAALRARATAQTGSDVGAIFAANTLGTVIAPALAAFALLPLLGMQRTIVAAAIVFAGSALLLESRRGTRVHTRRVMLLGVIVAAMVLPRWNASVLHAGGFRRWTIEPGTSYSEFVAQREQLDVLYEFDGPVDSVVLLRNDDGEHYLKVNGKTDASDTPDLATQRLIAHIPLLLHGAASQTAERDVFVVGVGSGVTVGSAALHPGVRVVTAELSRGVLDSSRYFSHVNNNFHELPNVEVHLADAREWLARDPQLWDVIINQPSNPWVAGNAALFSREFFELTRSRLAPGGVMTQWMHTYAMDDASLALVLQTFASVYPHVQVWWPQAVDMVLIGSLEPIEPDVDRLRASLGNEAVWADMNAFESEGLRIANIERFAALQVMSDRYFSTHFDGSGPWHTDFFPRLEQAATRARFVGRPATLLRDLDERTDVRDTSGLLAATLRYNRETRSDLLTFFAARDTMFSQRITGSLQHAVFADAPVVAQLPLMATRATGMPELLETWTTMLLTTASPTVADCDAWSRAALQALPLRSSLWYAPNTDDAREAFAHCGRTHRDTALTMRALEAELLVRTGHLDAGRAAIDALLRDPLPESAREMLLELRPDDATNSGRR